MVAISLVMHLHNALELTDFRLSHIGKVVPYVSSKASAARFRERAHSLFWPLARALANHLRQNPKRLNFSLSLSADLLEMMAAHDPALLEFWQDLVALPNCELLCEPASRGLLPLVSDSAFLESVEEQRANLRRLFGKEPRVFHNSDLIYSDYLGTLVAGLGFNSILIDGCEAVLPRGGSASAVFSHPENAGLKLIPATTSLTVDLHEAFRGHEYGVMPVCADQVHRWIHKLGLRRDDAATLFLSLTGPSLCGGKVVPFVSSLVEKLLSDEGITFQPLSILAKTPARSSLRVSSPLSMTPGCHDISTWLGNPLQQDILAKISSLYERVVALNDQGIRNDCHRLLSLENFERMQVQFFETEEETAQRSFQRSESGPYDVYLSVRNMIEDIEARVEKFERHGIEHSIVPTVGVSAALEQRVN